ncbi:hypothetical protein Asppvi_003796 [Aspergillus pseudoviridinutans]|uniref:J domain-containing protein n=1 Tax=Aspergillus pseudoviridinutans TaxID=1517512 RepID=A0A9P3ER55_9EURO|nr:uncharacterized protein Asppvi_003796 [Aspergillus pseudoviridinutans]GIJ84941.1 hypothetical protein Asppvi_003796 [Aspergillus pseudoviridinutans]
MVKPDVRRDYYADLGLTPSADLEDIKKQYRKLALKYHPDRNPGRELEFNAKFQAIQAAHEILSDAKQRRTYDLDRLRAGYGKSYGPPKPTPQKKPANPDASAHPPKPQASRQPFSGRPQSSSNGHSTGTQGYAHYARPSPRPPWGKTNDAGRTGADSYRQFQGTWGNSTAGSRFGQRTGRAGYTGAVPRPNATPTGQPTRPKSAYDYFKTTTDQSSRTQSTRKKHGFAPRSASGDEPMAANTSSYTTVPRRERFQESDDFQREAAPTATTEKPAAPSDYGAENTSTSSPKQTGSTNASTDGDRTFFSESGLHSDGVRDSTKRSSAQSRTPLGSERRKSASPNSRSDGGQKCNNSDDTDADPLGRQTGAVPKSGPQNRGSANLHSQTGSPPRNDSPKQPASDSNGAQNIGQAPLNETFKRRSRDDARKPFTAEDWRGDFGFGPATQNGRPEFHHRPNSHGRASTRASPSGAGQTGLFSRGSSRSPSVSPQTHREFPKAKFSLQEWADAFKNWQWFVLQHERAPQQDSTRRQQNFRKQAKSQYKVLRPTPQPASVATEADEAQKTVGGNIAQEATGADPVEVEAMDID